MKQIFDWMRKQPLKGFKVYDGSIGIEPSEVNRLIDEAEAKFGGHAICYLDSPCEYQNEDIRVDEEVKVCEWKEFVKKEKRRYANCRWIDDDLPAFSVGYFKFCPYCGKPINISEVE